MVTDIDLELDKLVEDCLQDIREAECYEEEEATVRYHITKAFELGDNCGWWTHQEKLNGED